MITMVEASSLDAVDPVAEMPFYSAAEVGGTQMACAAMMMLAVMGPNAVRRADDEQYWRAATGLEPDSRADHGNTTVFTRSLLTMHQRGLAVRVTSGIDLGGFALTGVDVLPGNMAAAFAAGLNDSRLNTEMALTGELLAHLGNRGAYQERQPTIDDVTAAMEGGWVVGLHTNGQLLQRANGYSSHSLVVTGVDGEKIAAHNPGGNGMDALPDQVFDPDTVSTIFSDPSLIMSAVGRVRTMRVPAATT